MGRFRKSSYTKQEFFNGKHRFEHWYRDNTLYFITSRTRDRSPAFKSDKAKAIFWDRFDHYATEFDFRRIICTLLDNHYHTIGYVESGESVWRFIQRLHGSVAKLVNDTLDTRLVPFWRRTGNQDYFDGCLRDETQFCRAYGYTLLQAVRAGIVRDWRDYPHTRVWVETRSRGPTRAGVGRRLSRRPPVPAV
jgi:REP element-mobilizing transposase RayT